MDTSAFITLALACAPAVHSSTALALVEVESGLNPYAIGVVGGALVRQPRQLAEALSTARDLQRTGWNFSVGLAQINRNNFARLGLTLESAFEPCSNLAAMQRVLADCFDTAPGHRAPMPSRQLALRQALSCYFSGDYAFGFRQGYVRQVVGAAAGVHRRLYPKEKS